MRHALLFLLLSGGLTSAATINSGTLTAYRGDEAGADWVLRGSGPGIQVLAGTTQHNQFGVPLCAGTCTFNFSGSLAAQFVDSFVLNGLSYRPNPLGYRVSVSLTFTGTPQTVTAVPTYPPPGLPGPIDWETNWASNPFTMTGVITVTQQTANGDVPVLIENIYGQGYTTGYSWVSQQLGPWNYSATTFTFVPEPSAWVLAAMGGALLVVRMRRGHRSAHS